MRHKFLTKLVLGALISTTLLGSFTRVSYAQSGQAEMVEHNTNQSFDQIKNEIEKYLVLNEDGTIGISESMPSFYNDNFNIEGLLEHFNYINERVLSGEFSINSDFSINQQESRYRETYTKTYWWGWEHGYSYNDAIREIKDINKAILFGDLVNVGSGLLGNFIVAFAGAAYVTILRALVMDMEYHNENNGKRGIVIDLNRLGFYNVYSQ